jgi:hypothetical protein
MCDEQLASGVFKSGEPPEKYKGMVSGIVVPLSAYDFSTTEGVDAEDMDGIKFFVPTIKSGEVSTEQFKMQLRMNKAVNEGIIRTRKRAEQIDPEFGSYSLLKAEPIVEEVKAVHHTLIALCPYFVHLKQQLYLLTLKIRLMRLINL